jgi:hypothetical protein
MELLVEKTVKQSFKEIVGTKRASADPEPAMSKQAKQDSLDEVYLPLEDN